MQVLGSRVLGAGEGGGGGGGLQEWRKESGRETPQCWCWCLVFHEPVGVESLCVSGWGGGGVIPQCRCWCLVFQEPVGVESVCVGVGWGGGVKTTGMKERKRCDRATPQCRCWCVSGAGGCVGCVGGGVGVLKQQEWRKERGVAGQPLSAGADVSCFRSRWEWRAPGRREWTGTIAQWTPPSTPTRPLGPSSTPTTSARPPDPSCPSPSPTEMVGTVMLQLEFSVALRPQRPKGTLLFWWHPFPGAKKHQGYKTLWQQCSSVQSVQISQLNNRTLTSLPVTNK